MKGVGDNIILEHYKKVAANYGLKPSSSMKDQVIRDGEVHFFEESLKQIISGDGNTLSLFDVGCGNGHLLTHLRAVFPKLKLYGLEFHPDLSELAKSRAIENCTVVQGDMRDALTMFELHDVIITERSVINLLDKAEQHAALANIAKALKPGGHYLMSESFEAPMANINRARKEMALPPDVKPSQHNLWLEERDLEILQENGLREVSMPVKSTYLSTHFYITRVLHPVMLPGGGRAGAGEFQNFFNEALPPGVGNYSPILFRAFEKSK